MDMIKALTGRLPLAAASLVLALGGCATLAGKVGIATTEEVNEQMAVARVEQQELEAKVQTLQRELEALRAASEARNAELEALIDGMEEAIRTTRRLDELAAVLEQRLRRLPEETIRRLVEILEEHLDSRP